MTFSAELVMMTRPDWVPPDKTPRDLEKSAKALMQDYNPNDPQIHRSLTVAHNRYNLLSFPSILRTLKKT